MSAPTVRRRKHSVQLDGDFPDSDVSVVDAIAAVEPSPEDIEIAEAARVLTDPEKPGVDLQRVLSVLRKLDVTEPGQPVLLGLGGDVNVARVALQGMPERRTVSGQPVIHLGDAPSNPGEAFALAGFSDEWLDGLIRVLAEERAARLETVQAGDETVTGVSGMTRERAVHLLNEAENNARWLISGVSAWAAVTVAGSPHAGAAPSSSLALRRRSTMPASLPPNQNQMPGSVTAAAGPRNGRQEPDSAARSADRPTRLAADPRR
jgi:hypothetical protein